MQPKIRIYDPTDAMPHLFDLSDRFERCDQNADVEIWGAFIQDDNVDKSNVFTIFVNQECNFEDAGLTFRFNRELRPNSIFAITAFSNRKLWPFPVVPFWSNIYFTHRANLGLKRLTVDYKLKDGCALFGGWEPGREALFVRLLKHNLVNSCFVNLQRKWIDSSRFTVDELPEKIYYRSPEIPDLDVSAFVQLSYTEDGLFTMPTYGENRYNFVSQLIPYEIYNRSYLNIVAETELFSYTDVIFLTEKIAKPLVAGQPFLVYAPAPGFLTYLKSAGFKTFSKWVDERYDSVQQQEQRANTVIDAFNEFSKQSNDIKILALREMQEVCDHNRRLATDPAFLLSPIVNAILQQFS